MKRKILFWLESHLVENGSYDFRRNDIIKNGPNPSDALSGLYQHWKSLNRREGAVIRRGRYQLCQIYWFKMNPVELAEKTNIPIYQSGSLTLSKLAKPE
jgi:hypothetical protein